MENISVCSYSADAAASTGETDRTIRNKTRIGNVLGEFADLLEEVMALSELVDASLLEFSEEYAPLAVIQEPKWRVRALLTKLDSDRKHGTDFGNKFVAKVGELFSSLPKPKEWQAFHNHDLPLLFTHSEVQQFALEHKLAGFECP